MQSVGAGKEARLANQHCSLHYAILSVFIEP